MWKHRFVENVQSQVHDLAFCAKPASYKVIQELDNKVRTFPFPPSLQIVGFGGHHVDKEPPPVTLVMQRYIAHAIWEMSAYITFRSRAFVLKRFRSHLLHASWLLRPRA